MKKSIYSACAVLAATAFISCSNEVDMFEPIGTGRATIDLGISSDDEIQIGTRATQTADNSLWYAKIGSEAQCHASEILGKTYAPGNYSITVSNYATEVDAYEANENVGDAYYEGTKDVILSKGTNTVSIDCGKAKNSKVTIDWNGTNGVSGLEMKNVVASQTEKSRSYTYASSSKSAFFYASTDVVCTISYTFNGTDKTISKTIAAPAAATEYKLSISANTNGTITTLTITYDDEFADGGSTGTTIDAATGEEVTGEAQS